MATRELRREQERGKRLANDALVALAGAGIGTPLEGFYLAPHTLTRAIHDLRDERDKAQVRTKQLEEACKTALSHIEDHNRAEAANDYYGCGSDVGGVSELMAALAEGKHR